ncbi:Pyruvate/Phosphoenolpyruvate kinase-like domain-containing protein [Aspergillus heterothallicus]
MPPIFPNNLLTRIQENLLCKGFGIRVVSSPAIVQIAHQTGYDALFIDLEHSILSLENTTQLCTAGLLAGITPFVRVPYQCGQGFVQRVLDAGAMGVIFPHIHGKEDAQAAVRMSKYPPLGKRSMTGQLPQFCIAPTPVPTIVSEGNASGSTVFVMIETAESIGNVDEIAGVDGVDVLLIGSNDLSIELGVPGQFESEVFRSALGKVSRSVKKHGKIMGLAGIYGVQAIHEWAVHELGVRFLLGEQDSGFIAKGAKGCLQDLRRLEQ